MAIIAFVDTSSWNQSVLQYAAWAANSLQAQLTIVARDTSGDSDPALSFDAYQQMDAREDLFRELSARTRPESLAPDSETLELVQSAARIARELGVARVRTATTSEPINVYIELCTDSSDLLVLARHDDSETHTRQWTDQFLKSSRRTMLLVPEKYAPIASWMIAIDGKAAAGRAVDYLTRHPLLAEAEGTAVFVGNDSHGRQHFRDAVRHLESATMKIKSHELQGNADDVLAAVLAVTEVDLLVMGAYGQGRFRSLIEGSTTSRILRAFRGPVLMSRA